MTPEFDDLASVDGWFDHVDYLAFTTILAAQSGTGDIVEVGPFLGRCAVVLGGSVRTGESLKVVDLFGQPARDEENAIEVAWNSYGSLSRKAFEENFLAFHAWLPDIHVGESADLLRSLEPGSVRFAHVDGSHAFPTVAEDLDLIRVALAHDGVVVIDDFRTEHAPGVAAAIWPLVHEGLLVPFALTPQKLYSALGPQERLSEAVAESALAVGYTVDHHSVTRDGVLIPHISGRARKRPDPHPAQGAAPLLARRIARRLLRPLLSPSR